ncbi:MAG: hypothetical protein ACREON_12200 [Gemmatimonadaceae bacterium]
MSESAGDELIVLHRRLLDGDRTASEELASRLLEPLCAEIQKDYPRVDEQVVNDGVVDAVLDYCARPDRNEASNGSQLHGLLARAAWRNVANTVRGEQRRTRREERFGRESTLTSVEDGSTLGKLVQGEDEAERGQRIGRLMQLLPEQADREALRLRLNGERRTHVFARLLGIEHLPVAEQRREVKRVKDRIDKVIRRSAETHG